MISLNSKIGQDVWNLYFNISKCGVLHIGKTNQEHTYYMSFNDSLKQITALKEERDLGVTFDSMLSFDQHISKIVSKANQMLGIVKRSFFLI